MATKIVNQGASALIPSDIIVGRNGYTSLLYYGTTEADLEAAGLPTQSVHEFGIIVNRLPNRRIDGMYPESYVVECWILKQSEDRRRLRAALRRARRDAGFQRFISNLKLRLVREEGAPVLGASH